LSGTLAQLVIVHNVVSHNRLGPQTKMTGAEPAPINGIDKREIIDVPAMEN
jgi:hypothetical protein